MISENRQLVTNEPAEVQDCREITHSFRRICSRIYPNLIKENRRMSICNRWELQTLGSQPMIVPKNLPEHCSGGAIHLSNDHACCCFFLLLDIQIILLLLVRFGDLLLGSQLFPPGSQLQQPFQMEREGLLYIYMYIASSHMKALN